MFKEIPNSSKWESIDKLNKGWSSDEKYKITTTDNNLLLLRISNIEAYDKKKKEYEIVKKYSKLGFTMSMPVDFGICNDKQNVYMLLTWIEGTDLEEVLSTLTEEEQFAIGCQAGNILKKIHNIEVDADDLLIKTKAERKLMQLEKYEASNVRIRNDEIAVQYVKEHIGEIWKEKPVYQHGDFHPGNLIYMDDGELGVIDFNRWEVGDPYEEFYKLESFAREISIPYCIGQIKTYFDDNVPQAFWEILAVYVAHASLYSIKWAEKFGKEEVDGMIERCQRAFDDYDFLKQSFQSGTNNRSMEEVKMHRIFGNKEQKPYFDRKGAYLLVLKDEKFAVIRTPKGYYLLGGGIDENEDDETYIKRECLEEIGYAVEIKQFVGLAETYCEHPTIGYFHPIQNYYLGELKEKLQEPIETDHILEWVPYEKLKNNMFLEMQSWALEECWKYSSL